ncbi:MAG: DUF5106 domain-containing protein [Tannerella sp.]|nr:DUF5106 domain-containing protein [Tannerella sp.]
MPRRYAPRKTRRGAVLSLARLPISVFANLPVHVIANGVKQFRRIQVPDCRVAALLAKRGGCVKVYFNNWNVEVNNRLESGDGAEMKRKATIHFVLHTACIIFASPINDFIMIKRIDKTIRRYSLMMILNGIIILCCNAQEQVADRLLNMMPEIPVEMTEPAQRAGYLVVHYWDKYDFEDMSFLMNDDFLERSFVDYLDLLSLVSEDDRDHSTGILMKKAKDKKELFLFISKLTEKYLYNPDSPLCDEEKYIPFLREELKSPLLNETEKIRPKFLLENVMKNRTGQVACDFTYTLMNDQTGTLHAIDTDYTLLYFNDPECEDCLALTRKLSASTVVNERIQQRILTVLAVYPNDDLASWKEHASAVLSSWIYSRDAGQVINMDGLYNIKRFPTIYLLDKDKKVLLKDTTFEKLDDYFSR